MEDRIVRMSERSCSVVAGNNHLGGRKRKLAVLDRTFVGEGLGQVPRGEEHK